MPSSESGGEWGGWGVIIKKKKKKRYLSEVEPSVCPDLGCPLDSKKVLACSSLLPSEAIYLDTAFHIPTIQTPP